MSRAVAFGRCLRRDSRVSQIKSQVILRLRIHLAEYCCRAEPVKQ